MELRGLIISLQELNIAKEDDPERFVMEDGLTELLDGLYRHNVQIINIDMFQADNAEKLKVILELHKLKEEECLMIAATGKTLRIIEKMNIASIGYLNPICRKQDLSQAEVLVEGFDEVDFFFLERIYQRKHGIPWTVIETDRCFLREMTMEDLDALYQLYEEPEITRYMEGLYEDREKEEEYTRAYINNMYRFYGYGMWLVIEKETGKIIGRAGLNNVDIHGEPALEMGYMVGKPYQNQGYATEVCEGILQFAAEATEFKMINCLIQKENVKSVHLIEKLDFTWEEELEIQEKTMQRYTKTLHF
ncbi:GNAT family N-acetyltransferase [Roseburia sp. 499]|uniref:GNAT family N-acetyltransferase n=1 Tax=Roseburia sp. 499 TaxID=1261634 RepID=UPI000950CDD9|nr:GNAT family N-acetyltransferase [Roseburia sp. 499]WVK70529.1 GNAT family N-acetyltransferase [Roseburia sp. 499]